VGIRASFFLFSPYRSRSASAFRERRVADNRALRPELSLDQASSGRPPSFQRFDGSLDRRLLRMKDKSGRIVRVGAMVLEVKDVHRTLRGLAKHRLIYRERPFVPFLGGGKSSKETSLILGIRVMICGNPKYYMVLERGRVLCEKRKLPCTRKGPSTPLPAGCHTRPNRPGTAGRGRPAYSAPATVWLTGTRARTRSALHNA
jgi:hypothetical protein